MVNQKKIITDLSRQRRVEKEFASKKEEELIKKPFEAKQTIGIDVNGFKNLE